MSQHSQHQHPHVGRTAHHDGHHDEAALVELLGLDAEVLGSYLDEVITWLGQYAPDDPRTIVDVGAGTGVGTITLARRFGSADVLAIDRSASMLEQVRTAADEQGLAERVHVTQADVDVAWPEVGAVDVAWAASSLHEVADPDRVLRDVYATLSAGGLLVVVEMDTLPRFLPDDVGLGRPGLEARCHAALALMDWNSHPDWRPSLEHAGFEIAAQRRFTTEASASPSIERFARAYLSRIRPALEGRLATDDLDILDHLLADDQPDAVLRRRDLTARGGRTAWAARRP